MKLKRQTTKKVGNLMRKATKQEAVVRVCVREVCLCVCLCCVVLSSFSAASAASRFLLVYVFKF